MKLKNLKSLFRLKLRHPQGRESMELISHDGVHYLDYLQGLSAAMNAQRYLEIGTSSGASLARIKCTSVAIDPAFEITMPVTGTKPACHFYQMTSDDYFELHDNTVAVMSENTHLTVLKGT